MLLHHYVQFYSYYEVARRRVPNRKKDTTRHSSPPSSSSLFSSTKIESSSYFVTEFSDGGKLCELLDACPTPNRVNHFPSMPESKVRPIVRRIAEALLFLHSSGVVFGGIIPHNVFFMKDGKAVRLRLVPNRARILSEVNRKLRLLKYRRQTLNPVPVHLMKVYFGSQLFSAVRCHVI